MAEKKDLEGGAGAPQSLTDSELDSWAEEIRAVLSASCWFKNLADNATAAIIHPDTMGVALKSFGYVPALLAEIRAARAWRKEAERLLREARGHIEGTLWDRNPHDRPGGLLERMDAFLVEGTK